MERKVIRDIETISAAESMAKQLRAEGYRVGVSGQTGPKGEYTGKFIVDAKVRRTK